MKKIVNDVRLMIKVCDMYYNQNLNQQKIASALAISRPTVSRLLSSAREEGIVKISISNLEEIRYWELERQLEDRYGLREVLIADSPENESEEFDLLGSLAAHYVVSKIKAGNIVGVSMGRTLRRMIDHIDHPDVADVTVVSMIGGLGDLRTELHSNSIAESLARVYDGTFIPLHAPARVSTRKMRDDLMKEGSLSRAVQYIKHIDVALLGIGYPNEYSSIAATGYFEEEDVERLKAKGVAGDICMQFYDINGSTAPFRTENNVVGADIRTLHRIPLRVGIAGGEEKFPSICGAVRGKYINVLITDITCARMLAGQEPDSAVLTM